MIRWLLLLPVGLFWISDVFAVDISLGPGLSFKNAILYTIAAGLFFRIVMGGEIKMELPKITGYFAIWIGYATVTCLLAGLIIHYPNYHLTAAIIELKSLLIDSAVFCLTVFYGLRNEADVKFFLKGLVGAVCLANVLTLADVAGIVHITNHLGEKGVEDGRVYGFFGHANETGTLIACLLPAMLVICSSGRPLIRTFWYAGTAASAIVLIMAVSRGAYVAVLASALWGGYLCRKYVSLSRMLTWGGAALVATVAIVAVACIIDPQIRSVLADRLIGQSETVDAGVFTSGRTDIWSGTIDTMMDAPLTLITGYGWYVYESMPFMLSTHNYYLDLWFDLGLTGVIMFVLIMRRSIVVARNAMEHASEEQRRYLFAFVCGVLAIVISVFFTLIFKPWPYLWMYMGAMLRMAVNAQAVPLPNPARTPATRGVRAGPRVRGVRIPAEVRRRAGERATSLRPHA